MPLEMVFHRLTLFPKAQKKKKVFLSVIISQWLCPTEFGLSHRKSS